MGAVEIRVQAEADLLEIWLYIARDSPSSADLFLDSIDEKCNVLAQFPEIGRSRPELAVGLLPGHRRRHRNRQGAQRVSRHHAHRLELDRTPEEPPLLPPFLPGSLQVGLCLLVLLAEAAYLLHVLALRRPLELALDARQAGL